MKLKSITRLAASAMVLFAIQAANAELAVGITPSQPTTRTPVTLSASTWFGDPGQTHVETTYSIVEDQIDMMVYMQDLHEPGTDWPQVITDDGGSVEVGLLTKGRYEVNAAMYMTPWWGGDPEPYDTGSLSFSVTPGADPDSGMAVGLQTAIDMTSGNEHAEHATFVLDQLKAGKRGKDLTDSIVSEQDLSILAHRDFAPQSLTPIPEPTTLAILGLGGLTLIRRKRR